MKVNISPLAVQKKFFEFYEDVDIVPFPDVEFDRSLGTSGSGFMTFKRISTGLFLSMDATGNWKNDVAVAGNSEKFVIHGDLIIHPLSGSAAPCYRDRIPTLPTS
jgi:hypothetical protein